MYSILDIQKYSSQEMHAELPVLWVGIGRVGPRPAGFVFLPITNFILVSDPLCLSSSLALHLISDYSFWVHHLVNRDDQHLLAHAMASDFSVAW
jgi:hypothetical protein